jgi:hypothetical protein
MARDAPDERRDPDAIASSIAAAAHELKNVLQVITSGLDVLTADGVAPARVPTVEAMRRALGRGTLLAGQLRQVAAPAGEDGAGRCEPASVRGSGAAPQ